MEFPRFPPPPLLLPPPLRLLPVDPPNELPPLCERPLLPLLLKNDDDPPRWLLFPLFEEPLLPELLRLRIAPLPELLPCEPLLRLFGLNVPEPLTVPRLPPLP